MSDELYKLFKQRLTRKELEKLDSLMSDFGNLEDVVITAVRKMVDPDFLTFADMEMCLQKAIKLNAYVSTLGNTTPPTSDMSVASQVAREVAQGVNNVEQQPQQNNPLAEMLVALKQQIEQQIMEEIKSKFSMPVKSVSPPNESNGNSTGKGNGNVSVSGTKDDIFKGDEL